MIYKYSFICLAFTVSLLSGCAKKEEESSSSTAAPLTGGVWLSGCNYDGTARGILFEGSNFNDAKLVFSDGSCNQISYIFERVGTYSTTTNAQQQFLISISGNFDKFIEDYAITPATSATATNFNSTSTCGFTDWASGTLKVVTGRNCGNGILTDTNEYDIYDYMVTDMQSMGRPGDLKFGYFDASHDGTTAEKRPEATNGNFVFRKYDQGSTSFTEMTRFKGSLFFIKK